MKPSPRRARGRRTPVPKPADLARTVDDVKRLAPVAGFYWVRDPVLNNRPQVHELQVHEHSRFWWLHGIEETVDDTHMLNCTIAPLTPPRRSAMSAPKQRHDAIDALEETVAELKKRVTALEDEVKRLREAMRDIDSRTMGLRRFGGLA